LFSYYSTSQTCTIVSVVFISSFYFLYLLFLSFFFFFFNDTATTEIYTLSYTTLFRSMFFAAFFGALYYARLLAVPDLGSIDNKLDRKSTRLNSSHVEISYAVFCLKKKKSSLLTTT